MRPYRVCPVHHLEEQFSDDEFEDASKVVDAENPVRAAERYVDAEHANMDYPSNVAVYVQEVGSLRRSIFDVECVPIVQSWAKPRKES